MKALLLATGSDRERQEWSPYLVSLMGKPFIIHVIERLVSLGVKEVHVVLHEEAERIEEVLGDGSRWGIKIEPHLVRDVSKPLSTVGWSLKDQIGEALLVAKGDRFPILSQDKALGDVDRAFYSSSGEWMGWACLEAQQLAEIDPNWDRESFFSFIVERCHREEVEAVLSSSDGVSLLEAMRYAFKHPTTLRFPTAIREFSQGVWVAKGARIDPAARLEAPLFLGENCQVCAKSHVGPFSSVEEGSIIDEGSEVRASLIAPFSYVGQNLHIEESIVDHNVLYHVEHGTCLKIEDEIILAPLNKSFDGSAPFVRGVERCLAVTALIVFSPIALFGVIFRQVKVVEVLRLPESDGATLDWLEWRENKSDIGVKEEAGFTSKLLSLFMVASGQISLVGLSPRKREEVMELPKVWREGYLSSKLGVMSLSDLERGGEPEHLLATELYYAAHARPWFDFKLLGAISFRWIKGLFRRS